MRRKAILIVASSFAIALSVSLASAAVRTAFPAQNPGPPYYAFFAGAPFAEIFRDDGWVAIPFVRDPSCVPLGFNLLASADIPAAFGCELTVEGFALWKNGPAPTDPAPMFAKYSGLGRVPVWFVRWTELQPAISGGVLTIGDLQAMHSLLVGSADIFEAVEARPPASPRTRERQNRDRSPWHPN